ncbi:hypothetical protein PR202_gb17304 [Eleusine coracana subsp. coracana]|uniref:Calmodulin-binding heat-shock protein n=1 Tax=Eleusine coracana subsp. coracana TaxID=191504 RepID=A0AAV5F2T3_ELECO|nr:hypothetical protein PR202_gb17304 [Eleusine coracana subsp. coracana]
MSVSCGLEWVVCLGCTRWAWKRLTYIGAYDSESWPPAAPADFEAVPRICRVVLANYDTDLNNPKFAPPGRGYADIDPKGIVKRATYADVGTACPPYLVYVDHANKEIVLAIRGLNLVRNADYKDSNVSLIRRSAQVLMDNKLGMQMFDGGYVHHGLLKAAKFILERETETLRGLLRDNPGYRLVFAGHSLGSGIAALMTVLVVNNRKEFDNIPRSQVKCYSLAPARCMSLNLAVKYADVIDSIVLQVRPRTTDFFFNCAEVNIIEGVSVLQLMKEQENAMAPPPQQKMERLQSLKDEHKSALQRAKTLEIPHAADLSEEEIQEDDSTTPYSDTHSETTTEPKSAGRTSWDDLMEKLFTKDEEGKLVVKKDLRDISIE